MFQSACERAHKEPEEVLREFLRDVDAMAFWDSVEANVSSKTVRMLFVATSSPSNSNGSSSF
jgi:hypothetical protein